MPFDGTGYERRIQVLDKTDKVIALLSDPRRWCKNRLRSPDGRRCIVGALMDVDAEVELVAPILLAIEQVTGRNYWWIQNFNDHPLTTHAEVVKVLWQARENIATGARPTMDHGIDPWARWRRVLC